MKPLPMKLNEISLKFHRQLPVLPVAGFSFCNLVKISLRVLENPLGPFSWSFRRKSLETLKYTAQKLDDMSTPILHT